LVPWRLYFDFELSREPNYNPKRRTFAELTFDANAAIHTLCQTFANRQPQSRTSKGSRGRTVCLNKGLEQLRLGLRRNAGPRVFDLKTGLDFRFRFRLGGHAKNHFAGLGKLDSIANQVG